MRRVLAASAMLILTGCALPGASAKASPSRSGSPIGSPLAKPSGKLDAQVPMPAGFPGDFPIYRGAKLTAGASFASSGQVSWGMEWQTLDSVGKVEAFYTDKLNGGDWKMTVTAATSDAFAATFTRKSDPHVSGTLASNAAAGVTKILVSLVSGA